MILVLDVAMALAWRFQRDDPAEQALAGKALNELLNCEAMVPVFWYAAVAEGVLGGERSGALQTADTSYYLNELSQLLIFMDNDHPQAHQAEVLLLARTHGLSAHEAAYLELAMRGRSVLATFDGKLAAVARLCGVRVYGDPEPAPEPE